MNFCIRYQRAGGHTHFRVFVGNSGDMTHGNAGRLCMTNEEFDAFRELLEQGAIECAPLTSTEFIDETGVYCGRRSSEVHY